MVKHCIRWRSLAALVVISAAGCGGGPSHPDGGVGPAEDMARRSADLSAANDLAALPPSDAAPGMDAATDMAVLPAGWNFVDIGQYSAYVHGLVIHPKNHELLYLITHHGSAFKSSDSGAHWSLISNGMTGVAGMDIAADSSDANIVYVAGYGSGVFKTSDGGASWSAITSGLGSLNVQAVAVDSAGNVWAGTDGGDGVDELAAGTTAFVAKGTSLPSTHVTRLFVDGSDGVWAGTTDGVARLASGGSSWTTLNTGLPASSTVISIAVDPASAMIAYVGLLDGSAYQTANGGAGWTVNGAFVADSNQGPYALAFDPVTPTTVYAGQPSLVFKATDGVAFSADGVGLNATYANVTALAVDPSNTALVFAGTYGFGSFSFGSGHPYETVNGGVFVTVPGAVTPGGDTWVPSSTGITNTNTLCVFPDASGRVFTATPQYGALSVSSHGGSFTHVDIGSSSVVTFAVDPFSADTWFAGTSGGLLVSSDAGASWSNPSPFPGNIESIVFDPTTSGTVYVAEPSVFHVSTDHGAHFSFMPKTGLPIGSPTFGPLAIDPNTPSTLYSIVNDGTYRSINSGTSWTLVDGGASGTGIVVTAGSAVLVAQSGGTLRRSTNGTTWASVTLPDNGATAQAFTVDSTGAVYAGTAGAGVLRSTDDGLTWTAANLGLPSWFVNGLGTRTTGGIVEVWAATADGLFVTTSGGS